MAADNQFSTDLDALRRLVEKLEAIHEHPRFKAVWEYAHFRLGAYDGPTYTLELAEAKAALSSGAAQAEMKPVAYRWRVPGATIWIYDPEPAWLEEHRHEVECQALYASPMPSTKSETAASDPAIECWSIVEQLRAPEGANLILLCDNPEFNGKPNNAIEIVDDWTQWTVRRFEDDSILNCLRAALAARPKV